MDLIIRKLSEEHLPMVDAFSCIKIPEMLTQYNAKTHRRIIKHSKEMENFLKEEAFEEQEKGLNTTHLFIDKEMCCQDVQKSDVNTFRRCGQGRGLIMYIDEKISLRDNLPDGLQRDFAELQDYYDKGDWFMFDTVFEAVEASVKAYYLAGKISKEDLDCIFKKYGIA